MKETETITKEAMTEDLKDSIGLSALICEEIVNVIFEELTNQIILKKSVTIKNFGKFTLNEKKARPGQNIVTGETVDVPSRTVLRFLPARSLKEKL